MKNIFLFFILFITFMLIAANSSFAAVPTFDVGLNSKMDQLLIKTEDIRVMTRNIQCMISNLHRKEYGPPIVGCSGSSGSSGLGSLGSIFNKITGIINNVSGGNFGSASGPIIIDNWGGSQSAFDPYSQDPATWSTTDSTGGISQIEWDPARNDGEGGWIFSDPNGATSQVDFDAGTQNFEIADSTGEISQMEWDPGRNDGEGGWIFSDPNGEISQVDFDAGTQNFEIADSTGREFTVVNLDQDSTELVVKDSAGSPYTVNLDQDSTEAVFKDGAGSSYTVNLDQDSTEVVFKDGMGRPVTNPSIINSLRDALNKIGPIKDIVKKIGAVRNIINKIGAVKSIVKAIGGGSRDIIGVLTRSLDSLMGRAASIFGACDSLDCIARKMAETAQGFLQQQILNWIRTGSVSNAGVTGRPLFVRDWDRYLLDAANYASSIFLQELQMTPLCEPFGSELKRIFGTGGGFSVGALSGGGFGGGISSGSGGSPPFNQILNCNLNSVTRNFQPFFDDFEDGGNWEGWVDLVEEENNPFGQYMMILEEEEIREKRAVQAARLEAESGDGFLGDKQCVERTITLPPTDEDEGGDVTYQDCPIVTPGIIQAEVTEKVAVSEQEKLQDVHEMKELFDSILRQEVQSILFSAGGLFSGSVGSVPSSPPVATRPPTTTQPPATTIPTGNFTSEYWNIPGTSVRPAFPTASADFARSDAMINFNWGDGSPNPFIDDEHFAARWTKNETFQNGTYRFIVRVDDGVRLYVDGVLLIDKWIDQPETTYIANKVMTAGAHIIKMEYYENEGDAVANLSYALVSTP